MLCVSSRVLSVVHTQFQGLCDVYQQIECQPIPTSRTRCVAKKRKVSSNTCFVCASHFKSSPFRGLPKMVEQDASLDNEAHIVGVGTRKRQHFRSASGGGNGPVEFLGLACGQWCSQSVEQSCVQTVYSKDSVRK